MKKSILAICILKLLFFLSCDINALNELLDKTKEKLLEEKTGIETEDLKSRKEKREITEGQAGGGTYSILNKADEALGKGVSELVAVRKDDVSAIGKGNIINEGKTEGFQWWYGSNEKTWENLHKMSIEARDKVQKLYDTWLKATKAYEIANSDLGQAISDLAKIKEENKDNDIILEAEKKVDAVIEVWKKAKEAEEKAGKDRKAADDYLSKVEATIEVFRRFLEKEPYRNDEQKTRFGIVKKFR